MHIVRVFRCSSQSFATHLREPRNKLVCRDTAVENHWYSPTLSKPLMFLSQLSFIQRSQGDVKVNASVFWGLNISDMVKKEQFVLIVV